MADDPLIPCQRYDSRLDPERGFEGWQHIVAPVFDVVPVAPDLPFSASYEAYHLGDILVGIGSFDATHFSRSRARIQRDGLDHVMVQIYLQGGYTGDLGARSVTVSAGEVVTLDMTRELRTRSEPSVNITLLIPRDEVSGRVVPHGNLNADREHEMACGLFADHMRALARHLPTVRHSAAVHVADATVSLYRAALSRTPDDLEAASEPMHDALLLRARRLVEARLMREDLSAISLAKELRVSRSTLYRLFEPFGGVASYVLERRLTLARSALCDPDNVQRIGAIGASCGFADPSHFSRAFRRRFGLSPAEVRREGMPDFVVNPVPERADLRAWIQNLT
ncbi:transcriptional regulator [Azorhizobium oxalatiphilum]|uniref:Transcriptional regulator n=1 Tax=Azorhizobium oxalatiphilum TaxID=980631 RepID=A0A917CBY2_9HYPH|nr:helix-turn-helix domain-containing protein [Azorhizobium oxalatiphilum]GGF82340.1 transcriptional regulator [Azorhizobium oxalatiphilum]